MKNPFFTILAYSTIAVSSSASAALTWTGASDSDLFNEANWLDNNGNIPLAGTINPNTLVTADTGGEVIINNSTNFPTPIGNGSNNGGHFRLSDSDNLTISNGVTYNTDTNGAIFSNDPGPGNLSISGLSSVDIQFLNALDVSLDGGSSLELRGGNDPLGGNSTVDIVDTSSSLLFTDETFAAFTSEHINQVTVLGGQTLVFGSDPLVIELGDNAVVSAFGTSGIRIQAIPEPSSVFLLGLSGVALMMRRRK